MKAYQLLVFLNLIYCSLSLLISKSLDWGSIHTKNDDECVSISLDKTILLWSKTYQTFCINKNGGIFVNNVEDSPILWAFYTNIGFTDTCTGSQCGLYFNKSPSNGVLSLINSSLKNGFSADAMRTIIVTWYNMPSATTRSSNASLEKTLQAVLTSDGTNTYFIVSFDSIKYMDHELINYPPALIGFNGREDIIHFPGSQDKYFAQNKLNCQSNVNLSGVYAVGLTSTSDYQGASFDISSGIRTIVSSCSNCQGDNLPRCSLTTSAGHLAPATKDTANAAEILAKYTNESSASGASTTITQPLASRIEMQAIAAYVAFENLIPVAAVAKRIARAADAFNTSTNTPSTEITTTIMPSNSSETTSKDNGQITAVKILNIQNLFQQIPIIIFNRSVSFTQVVSGSYPSNSFQTLDLSELIYVATFVGAQEYNISNFLLFMSVNNFPNSLQGLLQARKFQALIYKNINCMYISFPTKMENIPVIKLGAFTNVNYQYYSSFPLIWLYNTTIDGFGVCYKEQMAFSGPKSIWISYLAIVGAYLKISEASTYIFNTKLNSGAVEENPYCEKIIFNYTYWDTPKVFVTPEVILYDAEILINKSMSKIGNLISWVHSIDKTYTIVCTESTMLNQTHRRFPVKLHYIVVGDIDPCPKMFCREELECRLDSNLQPYCGCKNICNEIYDPVCGSNLLTYSSVCVMQKSFCYEFGNNTNIWPVLAYKGTCETVTSMNLSSTTEVPTTTAEVATSTTEVPTTTAEVATTTTEVPTTTTEVPTTTAEDKATIISTEFPPITTKASTTKSTDSSTISTKVSTTTAPDSQNITTKASTISTDFQTISTKASTTLTDSSTISTKASTTTATDSPTISSKTSTILTDSPTITTKTSTASTDSPTVTAKAATTLTDSSTISTKASTATDSPTITSKTSTILTDSPTITTKASTASTDSPTVTAKASTTLTDSSTISTKASTTTATDSPTISSKTSTILTDSPTITTKTSTSLTDSPTVTAKAATTLTDSSTISTKASTTTATHSPTITSKTSTILTDSPTITTKASTASTDSPTVTAKASTTLTDSSTISTKASTATDSPTITSKTSTILTDSPTITTKASTASTDSSTITTKASTTTATDSPTITTKASTTVTGSSTITTISSTTSTNSQTITTKASTASTDSPIITTKASTTKSSGLLLADCLATCTLANSKCINSNGSYICTCNHGFELDINKTSCVDINECNVYNACNWLYGVCDNTFGGYSCSCKGNLMMSSTNDSCIDINECDVYKACDWFYGVCNNTFGGYSCSCKGNWVMSSTNNSCIGPTLIGVTSKSFQIPVDIAAFDTEEVVVSLDVIMRKQKTLLFPKRLPYQYSRKEINDRVDGWFFVGQIKSSNDLLVITLSSNKFNSITLNSGTSTSNRKRRSIESDSLVLEDGQLYTTFLIANTANGTSVYSPYYPPVITVDPGSLCAEIKCFAYKNQTCQLINSTYAKCFCSNGFITFDNWSTCEDIDECKSTQNNCNWENSKCINTDGSFYCSCNNGWKIGSEPRSCIDVNECEMPSAKCQNSLCINGVGTYQCLCPIGSFYNATSDLCEDIDECATHLQKCDPVRGFCQNENVLQTNRTYNCSCTTGWNLTFDNTCIDKNECIDSCRGENSFCENTEGSFVCACKNGFQFNTTTYQCERISGCLDGCPPNSYCSMVNPGEFTCLCDQGYMMNNLMICEEIDECKSLLPNPCTKPHEMCINVIGGPGIKCICLHGYNKTGDVCKEISSSSCNSAAKLNVLLCPSNQRCIDTDSGFDCLCPDGFVKNSSNLCEDFDECTVKNICSQNSKCINTDGGFSCECNQGFYAVNTTLSLLQCYENSVWGSWEQVDRCSQLCSIEDKVGKILFNRECVSSGPKKCEGVYSKEEPCNMEFCEDKIKILKPLQCDEWKNMNDSYMFENKNDTWLHILRTWIGWRSIASSCISIVNIARNLNTYLQKLESDIVYLQQTKFSFRNIIHCNTYVQRKEILLHKYFLLQSKLAMYISVKTAFRKLQPRVYLKQQQCFLDVGFHERIGDYLNYISKK